MKDDERLRRYLPRLHKAGIALSLRPEDSPAYWWLGNPAIENKGGSFIGPEQAVTFACGAIIEHLHNASDDYEFIEFAGDTTLVSLIAELELRDFIDKEKG